MTLFSKQFRTMTDICRKTNNTARITGLRCQRIYNEETCESYCYFFWETENGDRIPENISCKCNKESEITFAGKTYANYNELVESYNYEKSQIVDKYKRTIFANVYKPPCFDSEDYYTTPNYVDLLYMENGIIHHLETNTKTDECTITYDVGRISSDVYDAMNEYGFFKGCNGFRYFNGK